MVPPFAVNRSDAVQGADDQQGPRDADSNGGQHPGHITCLGEWSKLVKSSTPAEPRPCPLQPQMVKLEMKELRSKEALTFSLISSNQLRTAGKIHTFTSMTLNVAGLIIQAKRPHRDAEKRVSLLSPWLRWTQTEGRGNMQMAGPVEEESGVAVASSSLSSSSDSSEFSSSSSGSSVRSKPEVPLLKTSPACKC